MVVGKPILPRFEHHGGVGEERCRTENPKGRKDGASNGAITTAGGTCSCNISMRDMMRNGVVRIACGLQQGMVEILQ